MTQAKENSSGCTHLSQYYSVSLLFLNLLSTSLLDHSPCILSYFLEVG